MENVIFLVWLSVNISVCIFHCLGIYKYNRKWEDEYLRGFDEGCKWHMEEVKRIFKEDEQYN